MKKHQNKTKKHVKAKASRSDKRINTSISRYHPFETSLDIERNSF